MKTLYAYCALAIVFFLVSCGNKANSNDVKVTELVQKKDYEVSTDSEVSWRTYTFKKHPLTFKLTDEGTSYLTYGEGYRKSFREIFYAKGMVVSGCAFANKYELDLQNFDDNSTQNMLTYAAEINTATRKYLLCMFSSGQFTVGSLDSFPTCIIDITNPEEISTIGFIYRREEIEKSICVYSRNGRLCLPTQYYINTEPKAYKTKTAIVTQDENNEWVISEEK